MAQHLHRHYVMTATKLSLWTRPEAKNHNTNVATSPEEVDSMAMEPIVNDARFNMTPRYLIFVLIAFTNAA